MDPSAVAAAMSGHPGAISSNGGGESAERPDSAHAVASSSSGQASDEVAAARYEPTFPTYRQDRPSARHERDDDDNDDDDDEALFAELDREVEAMDDEGNYAAAQQRLASKSGRWIGRGAEDADGFLRGDEDGDGEGEGGMVEGFDMAEFRERRMQEIRDELSRRKQGTSQAQTTSTSSLRGSLTEITHEKELIHLSSQESRVAIHFFHPSFERCKLLDRHLEIIARLHPDTLFLRANVLNCPFLTAKLSIKVLPCIVTFKDGVSKDKMVGFEELGNSDSFTTGALEWRLGASGIIDPRRNRKPILGFKEQQGGAELVGAGVVGAAGKGRGRGGLDEDEGDYWNDD